MSLTKTLAFLLIISSLAMSIVFSYKSFTGYLISDVANNGANLISFAFLIVGLLGSWVYISKFRHN